MEHAPDTALGSSPVTSRRQAIRTGSAAALGVSVLVLPGAAVAGSGEFGLTPLSPAGTMGTSESVTATALDSAVRLDWVAVAGANVYQVQYREFGSQTWLVDRLTEQLTLTVRSLTNDQSYEFRIIASDGTTNNVGQPTTAVSAIPLLSAPGTPVGVSVSPGDPGELVVTWSTADTGGVPASYSVRHSTDGSNWTQVDGITALTATISGLVNGTEYQVQVLATNAAGTSDWSSSVTGTPIAEVSTTIADRDPQPPVVAAVTAPTYVDIVTDKDVAENENLVYEYSLDDEATWTSASVTAAAPTFRITGLTGSTTTILVRKRSGATVTGRSRVTLVRRTPTYTAGQVYTLTNASGDTRIGRIDATVIGGSGGVGGPDSSRTGGQPSQPGRVDASLVLAAGASIELAAGSGGAAGRNGGLGGAGGTNAYGGYAGGTGAEDGPRGASGTGGGGGAASVVVMRLSPSATPFAALVAGGAGGGGGAEATAGDGADGSSVDTGGQSGTNGANGFVRTGSTDDAGGGGGGGGGANGGNRGGQLQNGTGSCGVFCTIYYYRSTPSRRGTDRIDASVATGTSGFASGRAASVSGSIALDYLEVTELASLSV
jgi:hypothetical protein